MKVLITGGAGFIGSHLADALLARKDRILIIDNYVTGRKDNLTPHKYLDFVEGTISDRKLVNKLFIKFKPDIVVHAAATYKDPNNWREDVLTNTLGGAFVTQASIEVKVKRLIYFQTSLCYGTKPLKQPIPLNHPLLPDSSYAISKTAAEHYISISGLNFISFRLANIYGPRNVSGPLPTFYQCLSEGKECFVVDTRRDFIYIADLIKIVLEAIDGKGSQGYYHISSGKDYSIKELFKTLVAAMNIKLEKPVEIRRRTAEDSPTILLDPSKTTKEFGWKSSTPLEYGVKNAVEWYKERGVSTTYTHLKEVK